MKNRVIIIFIFFQSLLFSQSDFEVNGYGKYLFSSFRFPFAQENYQDHLFHIRVNSKFYISENFTAAAELRNRIFFGETVENVPGYYNLIKNNFEYASLDLKLWERSKSIGYAELDRLWLDYTAGSFQATIGRQRIAWGTNWVWNPTDLFNPLSVLDFDYEERPAVDAARVQYYLGPVSKIEFAYRPSKTGNYTAAALLSLNAFDYDFNFISGLKNQRWVFGTGWSGDIYKAGFRGEVLISDPAEYYVNPHVNEIKIDKIDRKKNVITAVLSLDYTFQNSIYIHTEIMHNNVGVVRNALFSQQNAVEAGLLTAARWSVFQEFAYNFSALIRGSVFGIFNPDDKSVIIVPALTYSVLTNLDLLLTAFAADGSPYSEYGIYKKSYFARLKYSW